MITAEKTQSRILTYWLAVLFVFVILGGYGQAAIEWLLMKLYEFFVQRTPVQI
jgi:hypothetical protein